MTAYVLFEALAEGRLKLTDMVTVSEHAWRTGRLAQFRAGRPQIRSTFSSRHDRASGTTPSIALAERSAARRPPSRR